MRKPTIALLRRGDRDVAHLAGWFQAAGLKVVDIRRWEDVQLFEVNDRGTVRAYLGGESLEAYDLVYWAGAPGAYTDLTAEGRDGWYRNAERTTALLAALSGACGPRLINPGEVLLWGRQLADPGATLRRLASAGWRTPVMETAFDLTRDCPGATPWSLVHGARVRPPDADGDRGLAVFTLAAPPFMADRPDTPAPAAVAAMEGATRSMLRRLGWDWATIAVTLVGAEVWAHGARPELPRSLPIEAAARVIQGLRPTPALQRQHQEAFA